MFRMQIQMDTEKILREDEINLKKVYAFLDKLFKENGFSKDSMDENGVITYVGSNPGEDFGALGICIRILRDDNAWFLPNCKLWLMQDDGMHPGVWNQNDLIKRYKHD